MKLITRNILPLLLVSLLQLSCSKSGINHYFDATYSNKTGSIELSIVFSSNGKVKFSSQAAKQPGLDQAGTYKIEGKTITVNFAGDVEVLKKEDNTLIAVSGPFPPGFKFTKE